MEVDEGELKELLLVGIGSRERWVLFEDGADIWWIAPFFDVRGKFLLFDVDDEVPFVKFMPLIPVPIPLVALPPADDNDLVTGWFDAKDVSWNKEAEVNDSNNKFHRYSYEQHIYYYDA